MDEKKTTKITLSTFLLILSIIAMVVMGIFIYNLNNEKSKESEKSAELQSQVNSLNSSINQLEERINSILNTSTNSSNNNVVPNENVDKIAKELFESGSKKIRETQYINYEDYAATKPSVETEINGKKYQKRNVQYSEVEKKYSEIFTGDALTKVMSKRFAEVDGYLYVSYGGATGWDITNIRVSKLSESNNEIKYKVTFNDVEIDDSISKDQTCNMTIKLVNGNYRISSTDYCNL